MSVIDFLYHSAGILSNVPSVADVGLVAVAQWGSLPDLDQVEPSRLLPILSLKEERGYQVNGQT